MSHIPNLRQEPSGPMKNTFVGLISVILIGTALAGCGGGGSGDAGGQLASRIANDSAPPDVTPKPRQIVEPRTVPTQPVSQPSSSVPSSIPDRYHTTIPGWYGRTEVIENDGEAEIHVQYGTNESFTGSDLRTFGSWLIANSQHDIWTEIDGTSYSVRPETAGGGTYGSYASVTGNATYAGPAVGIYRITRNAGTDLGHFTADFEMNVRFGDRLSASGSIETSRTPTAILSTTAGT